MPNTSIRHILENNVLQLYILHEITSEMIFIVLSANIFQVNLEKQIDPMPLIFKYAKVINS
jgi:hypothetical protein